MTVHLRTADAFAPQLLADARDGLEQFRKLYGPDRLFSVLDIGAHYGAFTLEADAINTVNMLGEVIAVEASLANYAALLDNVLARPGIVPLHAAALETDAKTVALRKAPLGNSGQYSVAFHDGYPITDAAVPVIRFTTLLALRQWSYVKIDVEGAEWSLLTGPESAKPIMEHTQFLDLEVHPLDAPEYYELGPPVHYVDEVGSWFSDAGYRVTWTAQHPTRIFVGAR
jgi:FkbM family methyltransferase